MTTRKKKPFWTKLLSALLIASMLVGTAGTSSLAAAGDPGEVTEADAVSGDSDKGGKETPAAEDEDVSDEQDTPASETDKQKGTGDDDRLLDENDAQTGTSGEGTGGAASSTSDTDKKQNVFKTPMKKGPEKIDPEEESSETEPVNENEEISEEEIAAAVNEVAGRLQDLGNRFGVFQEEFFGNLTGDEEDPMADFAAAAAGKFGREFNNLLEQYRAIPAEVKESEYAETYAELEYALENLAAGMGGDLNSGVSELVYTTYKSYVTLYPSGASPTGINMSVGYVWNGDWHVLEIDTNHVKFGSTNGDHNNGFLIPAPADIWQGVTHQYNTVCSGSAFSNNPSVGSNGLILYTGGEATYSNLMSTSSSGISFTVKHEYYTNDSYDGTYTETKNFSSPTYNQMFSINNFGKVTEYKGNSYIYSEISPTSKMIPKGATGNQGTFTLKYNRTVTTTKYTYKLTWNYNGGKVGNDSSRTKTETTENSPHTFFEDAEGYGSPRPTRTGYEFKGWTYSGNGNFISSNGQINMTGVANDTVSGILTASWDRTGPVDNGKGISITKTRISINNDPSKTTAEPGDEIKWNITVTNNSNVTKKITLREQLIGAGLSESDFELAAGASKTVTAAYTVKAADKGKTLYNTVVASTDKTGEDKTAKDEGTEVPGTITLTGEGEFTVSKTFNGLPESLIPENFEISYNVTYLVDGVEQNRRESGAVSLTKKGDTYEGKITPAVWSKENGATWNDEEESKYRTVISLTEENAEAEGYTYSFGPLYSADATVSGATATFNLSGATFKKTLSLKNDYTKNPDTPTTTLTISKEAKDKNGDPIENPKAGETVKYVITVKNTGTETAKGVKVTDVLDSNLEYVRASLTVDGKDETVRKNGNVYSIGDIPAKKEAVLTIETKVRSDVAVGTEIENTAIADYENKPEGEPSPSGKVDVTVGGDELTVTKTKTSTVAVVEVGDTITWQIVIKNNTAAEKTVKVEDILIGISGSATVKDASNNNITKDSNVTVPAKETVELTASYTVLPSDAGKTIKNSVKVTDSSNPDDPVKETEDGKTEVSDKTTLSITKVVLGGNPKAGEQVTYKITVTNKGKVTAKDVVVTDKLDSRLENPQVSLMVDGTAVSPVEKKDEDKYKIGDLEAKKEAVLTITANVKEDTPVGTEIKNTATADHTNKPDGDLPSDDANFTVGGKPLDVSKTRTSGSVAIVGDAEKGTITWDIVLTNNTANSKTVNVKDILQNASVSGATVKNGDEIVTENKDVVVPARGSVTLTASYEVTKDDAGKTITNTVEVTETDKDPVKDTDEGTEVKLPERKVVIKYVDSDKDKADPAYLLSEEEKKQSGDKPFKDGDSYDLKEWGLKKDDGSDIEEIDINDHHYIVVSVEDPGNGTVDGDIEILVKCTVDDIGKGDGLDEPDGIPDKYQVVVTYRAVNGTIDGPVKAVVTLTDENRKYATAADGGKGNLTEKQIPGTSANEGYGNGTWAPEEPTIAYEITKDIEFVITYSQNAITPGGGGDPTPTPPGGGGGGGNDDDDDDDPTPTPPTPEITPLIPEIIPAGGPATPVAPTVTPVAATPTATAALTSPTPEAVAEILDDDVPLAGEEEKQPELEAVDEEETPLAGGKGGAWALINFALMNLAIFESIMLLIGYFVKTKNDDEEEKRKLKKKGIFRVISLPIAVISLIVFILTEDITLPTAFVDKYTVVMLIIAIVQTVMVALSNKKYEDEEEA